MILLWIPLETAFLVKASPAALTLTLLVGLHIASSVTQPMGTNQSSLAEAVASATVDITSRSLEPARVKPPSFPKGVGVAIMGST